MKLDVDGNSLHYTIEGREDGPVVVLSHSLATNLNMWAPQAAALSDNFLVVRYDSRGHGGSDAPEGPYTLESMADETAALIEALDVGPVFFVGLSMGGMIGQYLALRHSRLLRGMVLSSTSGLVPPQAAPMWEERIAAVNAGGMETQADGTLSRWFTPAFQETGGPTLDFVRAMILETPVSGFIGCCQAIPKLDTLGALGGISVPTRIIVGREDPGTPVAAAEALHAAIPGSDLVVLEEASHQCGLQQPQAFNQAVISFLQSVQ
ncbi:MAG: 3-oxoadipate enol-lactonase [Magnetospiraceae bacterium]